VSILIKRLFLGVVEIVFPKGGYGGTLRRCAYISPFKSLTPFLKAVKVPRNRFHKVPLVFILTKFIDQSSGQFLSHAPQVGSSCCNPKIRASCSSYSSHSLDFISCWASTSNDLWQYWHAIASASNTSSCINEFLSRVIWLNWYNKLKSGCVSLTRVSVSINLRLKTMRCWFSSGSRHSMILSSFCLPARTLSIPHA